MTGNEPFEESTPENYVKRVDGGDRPANVAARDTTLDETVIKDAKGGIPWPRCMIIAGKESPDVALPPSSREITGCPEAREDSLRVTRNPIRRADR